MAWFGAQAHCAIPLLPFSSPSSPLFSPPRPPGLCLQKPGRAASCFCSLLFSLLLSLSCFPQGSNLSPLVFLLPCLPLALHSPHPSLSLAKKGKIPHGPGPWPPPCSYVLLPLDNRSGGMCGDPGAWGGVPSLCLQGEPAACPPGCSCISKTPGPSGTLCTPFLDALPWVQAAESS